MSAPLGSRTNKRTGSRYYADPFAPDGDETLYVSVTTVLSSTTSKSYLTAWAAKLAAEFAVDNLTAVASVLETDAGRDGAVDLVSRASARKRDAAADRGSLVHELVEAFVKGSDLPELTDETAGYADAFLAFVSDHDLGDDAWLFAEATVCSRTYGYAGTCDGAVRLPKLAGRVLGLDVKTGANIPDDVEEQLAAYRYAEEVWLPQGGRAPVPAWDGAAVLHLRGDGTYDLVEVDAGPEAHARFLAALSLYERREAVGKRARRVLRAPGPDGVVPVHLADLDGLGRYVKACHAAGLVTLADVAGRTRAELSAVRGIGPNALRDLTDALGAHGLTFAAEVAA